MTIYKTYSIAKDFTTAPGTRYINSSEYSGQLFRETVLVELLNDAIEKDKQIEIDLDGTAGYPPSFLDEAFAGLIRVNGYTLEQINQHMVLKAEARPRWKEKVIAYLNDEAVMSELTALNQELELEIRRTINE